MLRDATELSIDSVLGRDYGWDLRYRYTVDVAMKLKMKLCVNLSYKNECDNLSYKNECDRHAWRASAQTRESDNI